MTTHRSTAYVKSSQARHHWRKPEPITNQFRFVVRMAYACHERQVPYDLTWNLADGRMRATITANGIIPMPRPLPKAPKLKIVADWKPAIWDAVYFAWLLLNIVALTTGVRGYSAENRLDPMQSGETLTRVFQYKSHRLERNCSSTSRNCLACCLAAAE